MQWVELSIQVSPELVEPLSHLFRRYSRGVVVQEEPGPPSTAIVRTYLPQRAWGKRARILVGIHLLSLIQPLGQLQERSLAEGEWLVEWKAHFPLLRVGHRLMVKPPWVEYQPQEGEIVLQVEPGMAFGTGHHPTTRMCLELLEQFLRPGMVVLDVGTGSGILAIAAAKLGTGEVVALDVDPLALREARRNLRANGVQRLVRLARGSLPHPLAPPERFHLALANLHSRLLGEKASPLSAVLKPHGYLIASGIMADHTSQVEERFHKAGLALRHRRTEGDWVCLVAEKE